MTKDELSEALKAASSARSKEGAFSFDAGLNTTILLTAEGAILSIDKVSRVSIKAGVVAIETDRRERFLVAPEYVAGVRQQMAPESSSGFLPGGS